MKGGVAVDLQVVACGSPVLPAEFPNGTVRRRVTSRCFHPSLHYTHWPSLMSFSDLTGDMLGHTETWEAGNYRASSKRSPVIYHFKGEIPFPSVNEDFVHHCSLIHYNTATLL